MRTEYRRDLRHSYLVLRPEQRSMDAYPLRMITENRIQGLLPCDCRRMDDEILYYYDVTSKISLAERGVCRKIAGDEVLRLVQCLVKVLLDMDEYLLNGNSLYLKPEYIYADVQMKMVEFCYVPGEVWDIEEGFRELMEGILPLLDHQSKDDVLAVYGLYHYAVQETFSVEGLQRQLCQCAGQQEAAEEGESPESGDGFTADPERRYEAKTRKYEKEWADQHECENGYGAQRESAEREREKEQQRMEQRKHEEALDAFFADEEEERHSHPAAVTLGTIGFVVYGLAGWYLWRNFPGYFWFWAGSGAVLIASAVFFIWRSRASKRDSLYDGKTDERTEMWEKNADIAWERRLPEEDCLPGKTDSAIQNSAGEENCVSRGIYEARKNSTVQGDSVAVKNSNLRKADITERKNMVGEEILMSGRDSETACEMDTYSRQLKHEYAGRQQEKEVYTKILRTEIGKKTYLLEEKYPNPGGQVCLNSNNIQFIGRLKDMADIILPSNTVSRLHARLRREENRCYLRDLNSRNGTWVNGQELQGEQEVEIAPGDEIRFADMIYSLRQI